MIRQNHIGDWGTPFGMLIEHWLEIGEDSPEAALLVEDPSAFYQAARAKFDASDSGPDSFATRARLRVVSLQSAHEETLEVWQRLVDHSKVYFNAIYSTLGVSLQDDHIAGESSYDAHLAQLCQELEERGLARVSEGALCTFPAGFTGRDGEPLPLIIRKSDGGYGYATTDLATIRYRVQELHADRILYVVGAPQNVHLRMVMETAREAGWLPDAVEAMHVQIGNVLGEDGKILKSRSGTPVKLMALLEEAVDRARAVVDASRPDLVRGGACRDRPAGGHRSREVRRPLRGPRHRVCIRLRPHAGAQRQHRPLRAVRRRADPLHPAEGRGLERASGRGGAAGDAGAARGNRRGGGRRSGGDRRRRSPSSNLPNVPWPCTCSSTAPPSGGWGNCSSRTGCVRTCSSSRSCSRPSTTSARCSRPRSPSGSRGLPCAHWSLHRLSEGWNCWASKPRRTCSHRGIATVAGGFPCRPRAREARPLERSKTISSSSDHVRPAAAETRIQ